MNTLRLLISLNCLILFSAACFLQNDAVADIPLGEWRHHTPGNNIIQLTESASHIIGATPYALILYDKSENSIERINKVHGLSDFDITTIAYSESSDAIIAGYENGNLDIIINKQVFNITDIMQASIIGSKKINSILLDGNRALLACDFGIVDMSLADILIYDTWQIGPFGSIVMVYDLLMTDDMLYAATNAGLLAARLDATNLADYRNWETINVTGNPDEVFQMLALHENKVFAAKSNHDDNHPVYYFEQDEWQAFTLPDEIEVEVIRSIRASHGKLIISHDNHLSIFDKDLQLAEVIDNYFAGTVTPNDALYDAGQGLWIADQRHGIVRQHGPQHYEKIVLSGPPYANSFGLASANGHLWVAPGSVSYGGVNSWNRNGIFLLDETTWKNFNRFQFPELIDVADIIRVSIDPGNQDIAYAASWFGGMMVFDPNGLVTIYNEENSTLRKRTEHNDWLRVGGVIADRNGNVWVTNSEVARPLSVKKPDGEWMSFTSGGAFGTQTRLGDIIIDNNDQKWAILRGSGIFVFKEYTLNNTNDFDARRLTSEANNGALPSNNVHSLALDKSGYVWVGTDEGVAVFYAPHQAFSGEAFNAQRIIVQQDDGFAGYLLETETVNCIEVDGSNKKWFGTSRSGAFLLSADGRETIFHFDKNNSPLPSNNILDIAINGQTGEVYFATDRGLVSFRGFATEATTKHAAEVYAYPNPVHPGYDGYIAVKGLVRNASVKITDISGNLVWETIAEGGQAVWNGQDLFGRRPSSGVYLVFSTNDDGEETMVTKIMFIQ
jgi:hypothetical protein